MISANQIYEALSQKYPIIMVDRIISIEYGKCCVGIKNVSMNEPWTSGHFPGKPILPGTYIIEAMAQTGGFIFLSDNSVQNKIKGYIAGIDKVKFLEPVVPGDCLIIKCTFENRFAKFAKVSVVCTVDKKTVARGEITYSFEADSDT